MLATGPNTKNKGAIPKQPINTNQSNNKSRESESVTLINIIKLESMILNRFFSFGLSNFTNQPN